MEVIITLTYYINLKFLWNAIPKKNNKIDYRNIFIYVYIWNNVILLNVFLKVFHTVGPIWNNYKAKSAAEIRLYDAFYICLERANLETFNSIALPAISAGKR